jgi:hypothetical protein
MKRRYQLQALTREQRLFMQGVLLHEMEKQTWYAIVYLELWKSEGFVSIH